MNESINNHASYNYWANQRIIQFAETLDDQLWEKSIESSFNSIKRTLLHIWDAEYIWLERLNGNAVSDWPSKQFRDSNQLLSKGLLGNSKLLESITNDLSGLEVIEYKNLRGQSFRHRSEEILHHIFNHSSFHRGQMITLMRQSGKKDFEPTDYIFFLRENA